MKYAIVVSSRTGNTLNLAKGIEASLKQASKEMVYFGEPCEAALEADMIFVGFWTDKGSCDEKIKDFLSKVRGKQLVLFGTAGFGGEAAYFNQIIKRVAELIETSNEIKGQFMCQGKMSMSVKQRYEAALEQDPASPKLLKMIDNFNAALERPSQADLTALQSYIQQLID